MFATLSRWLAPCVALALLVACQPIQPQAGISSPAPVEPVLPPLTTTQYPSAGITVGVPDGWHGWWEPTYPTLILAASATPDELFQVQHGFWGYISEDPHAVITFINEFYTPEGMAAPGELLVRRFSSASNASGAINPAGRTTLLAGPTPETINGQEAYKAVIMGAVMDAGGGYTVEEHDLAGDGAPEYMLFDVKEDGEYSIMARMWFGDAGPYTILMEKRE